MAGEDPAQLNDPTYRRMRLITGNMRRQVNAIKARVEWLAVNAITTGKNIIEGEGIERYEIDWKIPENCIIEQAKVKNGPSRIKTCTTQSMTSSFMLIRLVAPQTS